MAEIKIAGFGLRAYGDVIFNTDGAYDIGKSGATRPRHIYATGNMVLGGSLTAGAASFTTGAFSGNVTTSAAGRFVSVAGALSTEIRPDGIYSVGTTLYVIAPTTFGLSFHAGGVEMFTIASTGAATFSSTLAVTGNVGIGGASDANTSLYSHATRNGNTTAYSLLSQDVFGANTTAAAYGHYIQLITAAAAFTVTDAFAAYIATPSKGAASAITNAYGLYIENQNAGGTLNYAIYAVGGLNYFGGAATFASTVAIQSIGAFVASDKYLVVDSSGNIHKSATGPAS